MLWFYVPKSRYQLISQWYQHSVRFVKTHFRVMVESESNNSVFSNWFINNILHLFSTFFPFFCVSQEYVTLYLETRRSETLENKVLK